MSGTIRAFWENRPPGQKRAVVVALAASGGFFLLYLVMPRGGVPSLEAQRAQNVSSILVDGNTRAVTIDALSARNERLEQRITQLEQQIAAERRRGEVALQAQAEQLRREMRAAPGGASRIASTPSPAVAEPVPASLGPAPTPNAVPPPAPATPVTTAAEPARAADPVSFGATPPRPAGGGATPQAPSAEPSPSLPGDLSPAAVFGGPRPARAEPMGGRAPSPPAVQPAVMNTPATSRPAATAGQIRFIAPAPPVEQENRPVAPGPRHEAFIPAGSILSGVILAGFDAPTGRQARRDPLPALIRLNDLAILPNRFRADVRECFLLVSGFGDLSSERAYMRGETLSCVLNDGQVVQERIQAYATGEDGKAGVRGRLVQKQGEFVGRAVLVGILQGVAQAFQGVGRGGVNVVGTGGGFQLEGAGDQLGGGLAIGGARALDRIAQFYLQQAGDLFPVIEVSAGRQVDVILTGGATLRLPN